MTIVFDPNVEIKKVLKKYPSPQSMREHAEELIAEYGRPYYNLLLQKAIDIQHKTESNKEFVNSELKTLKSLYQIGERYVFVVTGEKDPNGLPTVKDSYGFEHSLITTAQYSFGDEVKCTVTEFCSKVGDNTARCYLLLDTPRIIKKEEYVSYIKSPDKWYGEVQELGKHKCGKAFKCSCCGRDFPAFAGWRVDLREIYFCNACAKKIYEPRGRGNRHYIITTPMGNKR